MSALSFKINAVYKELQDAIKQIEVLEEKIKKINTSSLDFKNLNKQIAELEQTIQKKTIAFAEMGANMKSNQTEVEANAMAYRDFDEAIRMAIGNVEDNARSLGALQSALQRTKAELSNLANIEKEGGRLTAEQVARRTELIKTEAELGVAISKTRSRLTNEIKMNSSVATSMDELSQALGRMRVAYRAMTEEERNSPYGVQLREQIMATDKEIKKLDASIGNHQRNVGNYSKFATANFRVVGQQIRMMGGMFGTLPAPLQKATSVLYNMTSAARAFIATPIGAVIAGLVVAITALTSWFKKSEIGMQAFAKVSGYTTGVLKVLEDIALKVGDTIYKAFTNPKKAVTELWNHIKENLLNRLKGMVGMFESIGKIISSGFTTGYSDFGKSWEMAFFGEKDALSKLGKGFSDLNKAGKEGVQISTERLRLEKEREKIQDKILDLESDAKGNQAEINALKQKELDIVNEQIKIEEKAGKDEKVRELKRQRNALLNRDTSIKAIVDDIDTAYRKLEERKAQLAERAQTDLYNRAQREIDLMKDGEEKKLKQIELNTDKELLALDKRRRELEKMNEEIQKLEWEAGGKKGRFVPTGLTSEQESEYLHEMNLIVSKAIEEKNNIINQSIKDDQEAWLQVLKEFGNVEEQRLAIVQEYEQKILEAKTDGEKAYLKLMQERVLQEFDFKNFQKSIDFAEIFSNIDEKSSEAVKVLRDKIAEYLKQAGESLTPEQVKVLSDAIIKADDILKTRQPFSTLKKSINDAVEEYKKLKIAKDEGLEVDESAFKNALTVLSQSTQRVAKEFQEFGNIGVDLISVFDDETADVANDLLSIAGGAVDAGVGIAQLASGDIIGGIKSLAKGIGEVVSGIVRMNDKAKERQIEKLQKQVEALDRAYSALGDAIENTYSKDASNLIKQQNQLLEQQKALIKLQIKEEEAKKKTDKKKIEQWKNELEEITKIQQDNEKNAVDAIFGEDIKSAIDNFAKAYLDAWGKGEDRAKAMKDVVKDMIRSSIQEMVKLQSMDIAGTVRKMIADFMSDDIIDEYEEMQLDRYVQKEAERLDREFGWIDRFFKSTESQGAATYGAYERITQDQASSIDGRLTAIQMDNAGLLEQSKLSVYALNAINIKMDTNNRLLDEIRMHNENMEILMDKADKRGIVVLDSVNEISRKVRTL